MALVRSIVFSVVASFLATITARQLLSVSEPLADGKKQHLGPQTVVVVMPVFVGNSNNRIGWVKEDHHHHHPLFKRPGS